MKAEDILTKDNIELLSQIEENSNNKNYFKWFLAIT